MWRVIFFTILALICIAAILLIVYRAGVTIGIHQSRTALNIPSQRQVKANETLVNEAERLFDQLLAPLANLTDPSFMSKTHTSAVEHWLEQKRKL